MNIPVKGDRFAVWDEVIEPSIYSQKWREFSEHSYKRHSSDVAGHDLLTGDVEFGEPHFQTLAEAKASPINSISRLIGEYAARSADVIGVSGIDWAGFTLTPWKYHANAALNWHNDGAAENSKTAAAFVLYIHPIWDASWSGDLLILDLPGSAVRGVTIPDQGEGDRLGSQILYAGNPYCVLARPNRLVLFKSDTYHAVRRVDPLAGSHFRASYTGFFLREDPRPSA